MGFGKCTAQTIRLILTKRVNKPKTDNPSLVVELEPEPAQLTFELQAIAP